MPLPESMLVENAIPEGQVREEFVDALQVMIDFANRKEHHDWQQKIAAIEAYLTPKELALLELVALHMYR